MTRSSAVIVRRRHHDLGLQFRPKAGLGLPPPGNLHY
jgi:hypothetical protein